MIDRQLNLTYCVKKRGNPDMLGRNVIGAYRRDHEDSSEIAQKVGFQVGSLKK